MFVRIRNKKQDDFLAMKDICGAVLFSSNETHTKNALINGI